VENSTVNPVESRQVNLAESQVGNAKTGRPRLQAGSRNTRGTLNSTFSTAVSTISTVTS
jgi:hypothetical protein